MAKTIFKKVKIIGNRYFHHFKMADGTFRSIETTKEAYEALATAHGDENPKIQNGEWERSSVVPKFDTVSGDILDGQIAEDNDGRFIGKKGTFLLFMEPHEVEGGNQVDDIVIDNAIKSSKSNDKTK